MTKQIGTSVPRTPTEVEVLDLLAYLEAQGPEPEDCRDLVECSAVVVFDHYTTDTPGYGGAIMTVVWPAGYCEVFNWKKDGTFQKAYSGEEGPNPKFRLGDKVRPSFPAKSVEFGEVVAIHHDSDTLTYDVEWDGVGFGTGWRELDLQRA